MEGWIKLYRKFSDWEWFNVSEMVHLFIYLLLNANHEEGNWRGVNIKRGQILTGLNSLNEKTGISIRTLRTCLDRLEKTKEIDRQTTNKYSIITICNYESYQGEKLNSDKHNDKQVTSKRQASDKQATTNNNEENKKNDNNEKNKKANKSPDFIDQLLDCFIQEHGSYEIIVRGKERTAMSTILKKYKEKYPAATSEETLTGLRAYFKQCINIPDVWLMNNMSPTIIVSKFNEINKILRNGTNRKTGGATSEQLASLIANKFGSDS